MRLVVAVAVLANLGCSASGRLAGGACDGSVLVACPEDLVCDGHAWTYVAGACRIRDADVDADLDTGIDATCADEGRFTCFSELRGVVCCHGHVLAFDRGPCTPPPDGGHDTGDPCANPAVQSGGCPCDPDAGTSNCDDRSVVLECRDGFWHLTSYTCTPLCPATP